jgi:hypothetical protein
LFLFVKMLTAKQEPPLNSTIFCNGLEWSEEAHTHSRCLMFDSRVNGSDFLNHVDVVAFELTDPAEVLQAFFSSALGIEPTG